MTTGERGLPQGPLLSSVGLVVGNLLPIWAVWAGHMSVGDVFVVYWLENVAVWAITIAKVRTARGERKGKPGGVQLHMNGRRVDQAEGRELAFFFALHYGIFTGVHGVFAFVMAFMAPGELNPGTWLLIGITLVLSHLGSFWINWYDGGERWRVAPATAMWQPYPRMLVLHIGLLAGFGATLDAVGAAQTPSGLEELTPVMFLLGLKTVVDLALHLWERRRGGAWRDEVVASPASE